MHQSDSLSPEPWHETDPSSQDSGIVQHRQSLSEAKSVLDCLRILHDEGLFTNTDVVFMQFLCKETKCLDLYEKCIEYAKSQGALCFFEKPSVEGYKKPQVHVQGDLSGLNKEDIHRVLKSVSDIVHCKIEDILLNGGDILH